jgi:hypothetical protein
MSGLCGFLAGGVQHERCSGIAVRGWFETFIWASTMGANGVAGVAIAGLIIGVRQIAGSRYGR